MENQVLPKKTEKKKRVFGVGGTVRWYLQGKHHSGIVRWCRISSVHNKFEGCFVTKPHLGS